MKNADRSYRLRLFLALLATVGGCTTACASTGIQAHENVGAPHLPPSDHVERTLHAPAGAIQLGELSCFANAFASASDCNKELDARARAMGGNIVEVREPTTSSGFSMSAPTAKVAVFYLAPGAASPATSADAGAH